MTKLLHVIIGLNVGGAEMMMKRLIESHRDSESYHHSVVSLTNKGKVGEMLHQIGVDVHALEMRSVLDIPAVFFQLIRIIRNMRPDIVQTWMYHADLIGGLASLAAGNRRVIWGIRTTEVSSGVSRTTSVIRKLCARLSSWIPMRIVCAADASRKAHINLGYDSTRMVVIPNGFDPNLMSSMDASRFALRGKLGFDSDDIVIGTLGRFNPDKDHENFVFAMGLLAKKIDRVRFLMVGYGLDAENAELAAWLDRTGYADRFVLLGERLDAPVCLSVMDIFCLSSRTEGFPNVVGEAMAIGLPCVVTNVGDAAILVGDCGVVVAKEDSLALSQGLLRVIGMSPYARQQLGHDAKMRIHTEFTMEHARKRFESLYETITERGNS